MTDSFNFKFSQDEFDDLIYAAREANIRFSRLRKCVKRGDEDVSHWTVEECDKKIQHYKSLESNLISKFRQAFDTDW